MLSPSLAVIGGAERAGTTSTTGSTTLRNVASVHPIDGNQFLRLTTSVRQNITATTRDDARATLELVDISSGAQSVVAVVPENPVQTALGTTRVNVPPRQMLMDSKGVAYAVTLSGLSVIPLTLTGTDKRPAITAGTRGVINSTDGTANFKPGAFITINGSNLAGSATADTIPLPTVLGGVCVVFNDVALPLLETSPSRISAQLPADIRPGQNVVQVRSLATAQSSDAQLVTVQKP